MIDVVSYFTNADISLSDIAEIADRLGHSTYPTEGSLQIVYFAGDVRKGDYCDWHETNPGSEFWFEEGRAWLEKTQPEHMFGIDFKRASFPSLIVLLREILGVHGGWIMDDMEKVYTLDRLDDLPSSYEAHYEDNENDEAYEG
jgi:hypothetical protein